MHTSFLAVFVLCCLTMSGIWSIARTAPTDSVDMETADRDRVVNLLWSANVSTLYPPSSPLKVSLGNKLNITCPVNATSNIWIQNHLEQYNECTCNATGLENPRCVPEVTTRQICQNEVIINIRRNSNDLPSALSFEQDTTFYLISYSRGDRPLAGYLPHNSGGECLEGFRMALQVLPLESRPGTGDETSSDLEPVSPSSRPGEPTYTDGTQVVNEVSESASDKTSSNIGDLVSSGTLAVVNLTALVSLIAVSLLILL